MTPDRATVVWVGPVMASNLSAVVLPPGWSLKVIPKGNPDPAAAAGPSPPEIRAAAYRRLISASNAGDPLSEIIGNDDLVLLLAFSAGGGFIDEVLQRPALRSRVLGVVLADAFFLMNGENGAARQGHLWGAKNALSGGVPFWATGGSSGGPGHLSGMESLNKLSLELPGLSEVSAPDGAPKPSAAVGGEALRLLAYPHISHVQHATILAARLLRAMLAEHYGFDRPLGAKMPAPSLKKYTWQTVKGYVEVDKHDGEGPLVPFADLSSPGMVGAAKWVTLARAAASKFGVPVSWILGVIAAESGGNEHAKGGAGEVGLMQIMPSTGKGFGVTAGELSNPKINIAVGAQILADDFRAHFDLPATISRYNAGPSMKTGVKLVPGAPWGYAETPGHILKVVSAANAFREALPERKSGGAAGLVLLGLGAAYALARRA